MITNIRYVLNIWKSNKISESFVFSLVKTVGERIAQILDSPASTQEKQPAEKIRQQIIVCFKLFLRFHLKFFHINNINNNNQIMQHIVTTILKTRAAHENEFDYLTTEFGAYFGPLLQAQLMKLRSQQSTAAQAQVTAALTNKSRTVITPQFVII